MAAYYSIRDLEELSGVKAHTIRMWEKRYGVIHPGRTDTNIRFYGNDELRKLLNVSLLVRNGYRISAVSTMSEKELTGAVAGLAPTGDEAWENLLLSLIELDESRFRRTFTGLTQELGFEQAVFQVIFPFFDRVGLMWQLGTINPAQEHFFSNLVRNRLITWAEELPLPEDGPEVLLFLPEHEWHELGLLFYAGALRRRGYRTTYLGQAVPIESLARVLAARSPVMLVTGATTGFPEFPSWAADICRFGIPVYFTGPVPGAYDLPENGLKISDLIALLKLK